MNENQGGSNNLLDTTDCLEAVGVFKGWKNFFFIIIILCILLLQICFWLVDTGFISVPPATDISIAGETQIITLPIVAEVGQTIIQEDNQPQDLNETIGEMVPEPVQAQEPNLPDEVNDVTVPNQPAVSEIPADSNQPAEANEPAIMAEEESAQPVQPEESVAETVAPEPSQPSETQGTKGFLFGITFDHLVWIMRFVNAVAILTATLYCLTILFSLKVSMLGRLGGINHITRAFFLSMLALVLLLPWHKVFDSVVFGAMFTPDEMVEWFSAKTEDILGLALYYLRFCGYWLLIFLLLILAQIRSSRWAGAILRRLEII